MRKKLNRYVLLFCFVLSVFLLPLITPVWEKIQAEKSDTTLVVGFDAEFPPYGYKDENGDYVGYDLDLAQEVCKRQGWTLVKQPIEWNSKDMELNSGTIDCIWNGFTVNGREDEYTWTVPYVDNSQVIIVRNESDITELSHLENKIVAVQSDSSALAAFTGEGATEENLALCASFKELQQIGDYNSAFMNLESGMVDAIGMDIGVAKYQVESRGETFRILETRVSTEQYAVGFKLGNTKLRDQVQDTLKEMVEDGTFMKISKKWDLEDCVCLGEQLGITEESTGEETESEAVLDNPKNEKEENQDTNTPKGNKSDILPVVKQLGEGMVATLSIFFLTLVFALPLGLLIAFARMSRYRILNWISGIYISIMRGTPLMLQLLVVFFGPYYFSQYINRFLSEQYMITVNLSNSYRFLAVIIGFSLNYAAYFAEIYRAGIQGVPKGQREAALVLGYSRTQTFVKIIFPQMLKRIMPPVTNEVITLVKDTSLAFALAYTEMFTLAKQISAAQTSIMPLFVAGVFYYVFNFIVAFVMKRIEKKMEYFQ